MAFAKNQIPALFEEGPRRFGDPCPQFVAALDDR
jgi:hypothetical protein